MEDPQGELNKRIEELKKDPAVAKMARELPSDPDFRRILERSQRKNESPLKTASEALSKAYANGGELPEELRGHRISDLYAARRQDVKRLAGVQPGAMDLNADESILVLAHLMAIREMELKSGGKDAKVDENAFDKRVEELSGDPYIRNLGAGLTVPKNKQILKKPAEEKDEPEFYVRISQHYPRFTKPYDHYQTAFYSEKQQETMGSSHFDATKFETEMSGITVRATRGGLRHFDRSKPAYIIDAYTAFNDACDAGLMEGRFIGRFHFINSLARLFAGDMNTCYPQVIVLRPHPCRHSQ